MNRFKDLNFAHSVFTRAIMSSANFHHLNLHDLDGAQRLVSHLVRLDRLPKQNTLEGLLVLREAWGEYDVAMSLADYYKKISKTIFLLQLLTMWGIVAATAWLAYGSSGR